MRRKGGREKMKRRGRRERQDKEERQEWGGTFLART